MAGIIGPLYGARQSGLKGFLKISFTILKSYYVNN